MLFQKDTILNKLFSSVSIFVIVFSLVCWVEDFWWFFHLFVHFQNLYFIAAILILFLLVLQKRSEWKRGILFGLCCSLLSSALILSRYFVVSSPVSKVGTINAKKIVSVNVMSSNKDISLLLEYLSESNADVVMLFEVDKDIFTKLKVLEKQFPFSRAILRSNNFGLAILSNSKINIKKIWIQKPNLIPALAFSTEAVGREVVMTALHVFPPIGSEGKLLRDQFLETVALHIGRSDGAHLICGDFNLTYWSNIFIAFSEVSQVKVPQIFAPTYTWSPSGYWPLIPIDHCLSKKLEIVDYRVGPYIGSDHRPIEVKFQ